MQIPSSCRIITSSSPIRYDLSIWKFDCIPISKLVYQCCLLQNNCCLWILPFAPTNLLLFNKEYGLCRYSQNWLIMLQLPCADLLLTQLHLLLFHCSSFTTSIRVWTEAMCLPIASFPAIPHFLVFILH